MHDSPTVTPKKISLISSDGDVFEVDYDVALMSKTVEDAIDTIPNGDSSISLSLVRSELLTKLKPKTILECHFVGEIIACCPE
ncbi:hypothetical protein TSUD_197550 [Trifolium subterraneum]|uniref:SKP1 component POZ domain-containing protein n=1 Tax=Trifolium subterraneum TaxID=3900 RepID=A0A2Z6LUF5_TRISU|nr:hypothetical protein TSUD_197550 [Trifolium subterraneum]